MIVPPSSVHPSGLIVRSSLTGPTAPAKPSCFLLFLSSQHTQALLGYCHLPESYLLPEAVLMSLLGWLHCLRQLPSLCLSFTKENGNKSVVVM